MKTGRPTVITDEGASTMLIDYLEKLSHDLHTASDVLDKLSKASHNAKVSEMLDKIAIRLDIHAKQLDEIATHKNSNSEPPNSI